MTQIPNYDRGFRDGVRTAVTWLHNRAAEMNDPHAQAVLRSASTNLGWDNGRGLVTRHLKRVEGEKEYGPVSE